MDNLKEYLSLKLVRIAGSLFLLILLLLSLLTSRFSDSTVSAAGEWLAPEERVVVNLSGTFQDTDGKAVRLGEFKDEVLLLNFWATWCGPCLMEMPSMASLHEEFGKKGLRIVAVTDEDADTVRGFLEENPFPFTVLIDSERKLSERLGVWAIPLTLILDKGNKLIYFHQGARLWDTPDIKQQLARLVSE